MTAATHCPHCGNGLLPRWLHPMGTCPGCGADPRQTDEQRQRAALLEVRELTLTIRADLVLFVLGIDCILAEIDDALEPLAVVFDGMGGDPR
jgi:uncharacterized protein (DUF983 family)